MRNVLAGGAPIRASLRSARWRIEIIERLREQRRDAIRVPARAAAIQAYDEAVEQARHLADDAPAGS